MEAASTQRGRCSNRTPTRKDIFDQTSIFSFPSLRRVRCCHELQANAPFANTYRRYNSGIPFCAHNLSPRLSSYLTFFFNVLRGMSFAASATSPFEGIVNGPGGFIVD